MTDSDHWHIFERRLFADQPCADCGRMIYVGQFAEVFNGFVRHFQCPSVKATRSA